MISSLKAHELKIGYPNRVVINNINAEFQKGEFVSIVGPNGSGKTTFLRSLCRILKPIEGDALVNGNSIYKMKAKESARLIAFAPQDEQTVFSFTVREVVMMGRTPHVRGLSETKSDFEIVDNALEMMGLTRYADRPVEQLSGGERQRVTIARALAQNADFLILDEPLAHLDIGHQASLLSKLRSMVLENKIGLITALHDLNLASEFSDRILLMQNGELIASGSPGDVFVSDRLQRVYGVPVLVRPNPITGKPSVFPLPTAVSPAVAENAPIVHVVCGGGTGAGLFPLLLELGYNVTVGVTNLLDTDEEAARSLGLTQVSTNPFSGIDGAIINDAFKLIDKAEIVLVSDAPFGTGNLHNLDLAEYALKLNKTVLLIGEAEFNDRDYCDGQAKAKWDSLIQAGALRFDTGALVIKHLSKVYEPL